MTTLSFDNAIGRAALLTAAACVPCAPALAAQPFHAGDIVVSIYGNGAGNGRYGHNQASPIVLRELTTSGAFVSQLVLPQSNSKDAAGVAHSAISGEYGSSSEGTLQRSADGQLLAIMGYGVNADEFNAATAAAANPYGTQALAQTSSVKGGSDVAVARVVATVSAQGRVDTSTALYGFADRNNPRSVATTDGTSFYVAGQGVKGDATQGVQYVLRGAAAGSVVYRGIDVRTATIANGGLYVSADTKQGGTAAAKGSALIAAYGSVPIAGSATPVPLAGIDGGVVLAGGQGNGISTAGRVNLSPENFFFADATTLYVADSGQPKQGGLGDGGLQKWSLVAGTWRLDYTLADGLDLVPNTASSGTTGLIGLAGRVVDGQVELFATNVTRRDTGQTYLYRITDRLSATEPGAGQKFAVLATAAPDTVIRGVSFAPVGAASTQR